MPFYIDANDCPRDKIEVEGYDFTFVEELNNDQIQQFLVLQKIAEVEISQEISILSELGLKEKLENRSPFFLFLLVYFKSEIVGYVYSYEYPEKEKSCYIDTIYIKENHRNNKLGLATLNNLISENIERHPHFSRFKVVTQPNNMNAIRLLEKNGFKYFRP